MNAKTIHPRLSMRLALFAAVLLVTLAACQPAATQPPAQPSPTTPADTPVVLPTQAQPQPTASLSPTQPEATQAEATPASPSAMGEITLDLTGIASDQTVETVDAKPAGEGEPYYEVAPQYRRITLTGYPVTSHLHKPQIFVYPVADLAGYNANAAKQAEDLKALLESEQAGERLPYLPFYNAAQVMHAQVQYIDFKNGSGVRYLTQYDQAPLPINSYELVYTFQGLTSDGRYYVSAVLPVSHPDLPATSQVSPEMVDEMNEFETYLAEAVSQLETLPGEGFTPSLAALDAMVQSIEVK